MTISQELIELIDAKPVSNTDLEQAALFAPDAIANAFAGQNSAPGRILLDWGRANHATFSHQAPEAALDSGRRALLLGGLTHILELDDLHRASVVHPGCVVVPAVWALVESVNAYQVALDVCDRPAPRRCTTPNFRSSTALRPGWPATGWISPVSRKTRETN